MQKFGLADLTTKYYDKVDENVVELKSAFIGLCSEADRYFKTTLGINLSEEITEFMSEKFIKIFPCLASITLEQFEQLRCVFDQIRDVNAHLFLNKPIFIPRELSDYLQSVATPKYPISIYGELTMYGMIYVLNFICHRYQTWPFACNVITSKYFSNVPTKKHNQEALLDMWGHLKTFCASGKPILASTDDMDKSEVLSINDACKKHLTNIFFGLEKGIWGSKTSSPKEPPFSYLIRNNKPFADNKNLSKKLVRLRNAWFHGSAIFDEVHDKNGAFTYSLEYIFHTLLKLKRVLTEDERYAYVVDLISEFGKVMVDFYVLRIIEISYKLFDKSLLTEDKIDSRIDGVTAMVTRLEKVDPKFFEMAMELNGEDILKFSMQPSRFLDGVFRKTVVKKVKILKVRSNSELTIGDFRSNRKEVAFALVNLDNKYLNKINGIFPKKLQRQKEKNYSPKICIYNVNLD